MVVGNCGVGKSTFSKKLSLLTNIELIHLDLYYWEADWIEPEKAMWDTQVKKLVGKRSWIMDGNYGGTMDIRIDKADTIIFLNYPTRIALWRVLKRMVRYWKKSRPDMPGNCKERFDLNFLFYVVSFNSRRKRMLLDKLSSNRNKKNILIFENDIQADNFLEGIQ